jgi:hypothetical protein
MLSYEQSLAMKIYFQNRKIQPFGALCFLLSAKLALFALERDQLSLRRFHEAFARSLDQLSGHVTHPVAYPEPPYSNSGTGKGS